MYWQRREERGKIPLPSAICNLNLPIPIPIGAKSIPSRLWSVCIAFTSAAAAMSLANFHLVGDNFDTSGIPPPHTRATRSFAYLINFITVMDVLTREFAASRRAGTAESVITRRIEFNNRRVVCICKRFMATLELFRGVTASIYVAAAPLSPQWIYFIGPSFKVPFQSHHGCPITAECPQTQLRHC